MGSSQRSNCSEEESHQLAFCFDIKIHQADYIDIAGWVLLLYRRVCNKKALFDPDDSDPAILNFSVHSGMLEFTDWLGSDDVTAVLVVVS